jgi:hypothetical protein
VAVVGGVEVAAVVGSAGSMAMARCADTGATKAAAKNPSTATTMHNANSPVLPLITSRSGSHGSRLSASRAERCQPPPEGLPSSPTCLVRRARSAKCRPIRTALRSPRSTSRPRPLGQTPGVQPPIPGSRPPPACGRNPRTASRVLVDLPLPRAFTKRRTRARFLAPWGRRMVSVS